MVRKNYTLVRKIEKTLLDFKKYIEFKLIQLSLWVKVALVWNTIIFFSLFLSWVESSSPDFKLPNGDIWIGPFSLLSWYVWYFILVILAIITFSLLSHQKRQRIKYASLLDISDILACLFGSLIIFLLTLHTFFHIYSFQMFSQYIIYGKGIIFATTGSIILFAAYIIMKYGDSKTSIWSYSHEEYDARFFSKKEDTQDNMKLPF